jgi:hypothetical protein
MQHSKIRRDASITEPGLQQAGAMASFSDSRATATAQRKIQDLIHTSPQTVAQHKLQTQLAANPIQRKLQVWDNPFITDQEKKTVPQAATNSVLYAANAIDDGLEEGARILRSLWIEYQATGDTNELHRKLVKKSPPKAKRYITNFINRITDSVLKKKAYKPSKEAGYIVEAFANKAATDAGIETQVAIGTARPDYRKVTGQNYRQDNGNSKVADGLIDATSAAEAAKGHILSKMFKMSEDSARAYPTLYDCYYDDLGLGKSPVRVKLNPKIVKRRQDKWKREKELAKMRRSSLRKRGGRKVNYRV